MTIARFMCAECGWVYESRLAAVECGQFDKAEGRNPAAHSSSGCCWRSPV